MINEIEEVRSTDKPSWLELPEEEKQNHTYWSCDGISHLDIVPYNQSWVYLFHSKEEAETHCSIKRETWTWDGNPATPRELKKVMFEVRRKDMLGIIIKGYKDGVWTNLKEYPASVPLMDE